MSNKGLQKPLIFKKKELSTIQPAIKNRAPNMNKLAKRECRNSRVMNIRDVKFRQFCFCTRTYGKKYFGCQNLKKSGKTFEVYDYATIRLLQHVG